MSRNYFFATGDRHGIIWACLIGFFLLCGFYLSYNLVRFFYLKPGALYENLWQATSATILLLAAVSYPLTLAFWPKLVKTKDRRKTFTRFSFIRCGVLLFLVTGFSSTLDGLISLLPDSGYAYVPGYFLCIGGVSIDFLVIMDLYIFSDYYSKRKNWDRI